MTTYVDYTYYQNTYHGVAIASTDFPRLAAQASAEIDTMTFNRAAEIITANTDAVKIDKIKMACCAVAEKLQKIELSGGDDAIQAESIGSNSVTYAKGSDKLKTSQSKTIDAARTYLSPTGLLFRGFSENQF